jgi:hypothetical protein
MDVEHSNQLLDNVSGTLYEMIPHGSVSYERLRFMVKQGILLHHVNLTIQKLLEENIVATCMQHLFRMDSHIHTHPDFLREVEDDLDSMDSDSIYIQYAILVKKYQRICLSHEKELVSLLHTIATATLNDMLDVIEIANDKIKEYRDLKKNVCSSLFRVFEYMVEYEQLQLMLPLSLPSSSPLPEQEEESLPASQAPLLRVVL